MVAKAVRLRTYIAQVKNKSTYTCFGGVKFFVIRGQVNKLTKAWMKEDPAAPYYFSNIIMIKTQYCLQTQSIHM